MGSWGYYIYKPDYGAFGTTEWWRFDQGLLSADERLHALTEETTSISADLSLVSGDTTTINEEITVINEYITILSADVTGLCAEITALDSYADTLSSVLDSTIIIVNDLETDTQTLSSTLITVIDEVSPLTAHDTRTVLFPEYPGAVIAETPGGNNEGTLISDVDFVGNYKYNHYKWTTTSSGGAMQMYDVHVQWRIPDTFVAFYSGGASGALLVDMATSETTNTCAVIVVTLQKDGVVTTSELSATSVVASTWYSANIGTELIGFGYNDAVLSVLSAQDTLNIELTMAVTCASWAKVGAITLRYMG